MATKKNADAFKRDVRETQGLGAGAPARTAASAPGRAPSEIPGGSGISAAAAAAAAGRKTPQGAWTAPPPPADDDYEEDADLAAEVFGRDREREFADAGPAGTAAVLAQADAPSVMRKVDHGVTVERQVFPMAENIGINDQTMRMLASLDFDGDPGADAVDAALDEAVAFGEEPPPPPGPPPAPVEIERADRASAAATQWPDRAPKGGMPAVPHSEVGLDEAVKKADLGAMTGAFLSEVLSEKITARLPAARETACEPKTRMLRVSKAIVCAGAAVFLAGRPPRSPAVRFSQIPRRR